jgi:modulator of FtsH protease HflK
MARCVACGAPVAPAGMMAEADAGQTPLAAGPLEFQATVTVTVELQDVVPPERVQPAFNEVNEARQELERMVNEANREFNLAIPRAQGEAQRIIAEAQGYATERVNRALGDSARFSAVLAEYAVAPDVTRSRLYLETLHEALPRIGTVLVVQEGQVPPLPLFNLREPQPQQVRNLEASR